MYPQTVSVYFQVDTMPALEITNFNIIVSLLGGWIAAFGLVSYLSKENLYLSEARKLFSLLLLLGHRRI